MLRSKSSKFKSCKRKHEDNNVGHKRQKKSLKHPEEISTKSKPYVLGLNARDEEERRLEELVFGDPSAMLRNLQSCSTHRDTTAGDSGVEDDGSGHSNEDDDDNDNLPTPDSAMSPDHDKNDEDHQPAWVDDDDVNVIIKPRRARGPAPSTSNEDYSKSLKKKFEAIMGTPKWAEIGSKSKADSDDDDDESDSELLQHCGGFLVKGSSTLTKGTLAYKKLRDINQETYSEGAIIKAAEFHSKSSVGLVAGMSGVASIFQVDGKDNTKLHSVQFERFPITCAHFTRDGEQFIVGSQHHKHFFSYDMIAGKTVRIPPLDIYEQPKFKVFEMSPDGHLIAVIGKFGNIHLLTNRSKECIGTMKANGEVKAVAFNPDGSRLLSHGDAGEVCIWDINSRSCLHKFIDDGCILGTSIAVSPNEQYLACGSRSGAVNIYDASSVMSTTTPRPMKIVLNLVTGISSLKFNPSSEILAMASYEKENAVKLVHFPSMTTFSNFPGFQSNLMRVQCLDFSVNSGYFCLGNNKGAANLFRLSHYGNY